jgi:capsular polysaccharide transport system permease protein
VSLARGLRVQLQVIHALALRETRTRFGAHQLGYLWALIEPLVWIATFYAMFYLLGREAPFGMDLVGFLATGIVPFKLFREVSQRSMNAVDANKALLFYPQVRPLDVIVARTYLEVATLFAVFAVLMGGNALIHQELRVDSLFRVLSGLGLAAAVGASFGLVLAGLSVFNNAVERIVGPMLRPLFWVSGLFFTANGLPSQVRDVLLWNPVLHCVELVRDGWFLTYRAYYLDVSYVLGWIATCSFLGLTLERVARRRLEVT